MHHEAIDTLLKALAQALAPYMVESVIDHLGKNGTLTTKVDKQVEDWLANNFDVENYIDIDVEIDKYMSHQLHDMVRDEVRELSFSVTVD